MGPSDLQITLNGDAHEIAGPLTVTELLAQLQIDARRVAVEHNLVVLKRETFEKTMIHEGDEVEIVNFVGGWLAETCGTAAAVNKALFRRGADYRRPTLWLYGKGDATFSIEHSRANFDAFVQAGGKGKFYDLAVPNSTRGHLLIAWPERWLPLVEQYLKDLDAQATP